MKDTIYDRVREKYWKIIPYDYRPGQLLYKLKCFLFKRYSTVRPRWLGHTWIDRDNLLFFCSFEVLCRFIEEECSPGNIDWYANPDKVKVIQNGSEVLKNPRDEMQDLYNWFNNDYLPFWENKVYDEIYKGIEYPEIKFTPIEPVEKGYLKMDLVYSSDKVKERYNEAAAKYDKISANFKKERKEMLHRLINIMDYMWT